MGRHGRCLVFVSLTVVVFGPLARPALAARPLPEVAIVSPAHRSITAVDTLPVTVAFDAGEGADTRRRLAVHVKR